MLAQLDLLLSKKSPAATAAQAVASAREEADAAWHSARHMLNKEGEVIAQAAAAAAATEVRRANRTNRLLGPGST